MIRPGVLAGADLIASRRELANIELTLAGLPRHELVRRRCLRDMRARYDYIPARLPPNLGLLTVNALCAAGEAIVPLEMKSVDALAGAEELIATARALEQDGPRITALVRHRIEGSAPHRRRAYRAIDAQLGLPATATLIPARDAFEHAAIQHASLVAPRSRPRRLASLPPPHRRAQGRGMTRGELKVTRIDSLPVTSRRDASREHLCR